MSEEKNISEKENDSKKITNSRTLALRIGSLICALLLWMYVSEIESPTAEETFSDVVVTVENRDVLRRDHELAMITTAQFKVDVVLSGKRSTLNHIKNEDIKAYIDLGKTNKAGEQDIEIQILCPDGTKLVTSSPQHATVMIDKTVTEEFPIVPKLLYSNPSAYTLGEPIITDSSARKIETVSVSGPKTEIDRIFEIRAEADFGNLDWSKESSTSLVMYDNLGQEITSSNLKLSTETVKIKQPVYTQKLLKLSVEQAHNTFAENQIVFNVSPSTIAVSGDPKLLSEMDSITIYTVNERNIGTSLTDSFNIPINLPDGIEITSDKSMANVKVTLINVKKERISLDTSSIVKKNLGENLVCTFEDKSIEANVINANNTPVNKEGLIAELDLTSYTAPGTYTANVKVNVLEKINDAFVVAEDYPVTFTINEKSEK